MFLQPPTPAAVRSLPAVSVCDNVASAAVRRANRKGNEARIAILSAFFLQPGKKRNPR